MVCAGQAGAQTLPADSVRADTLRSPAVPADTLRALAAPFMSGLPRIPMADAAPPTGPDTTASLPGIVLPAGVPALGPTASPALPQVELVSTARPVVLVRGAGAARAAAPPIESARVQVDSTGQRTLVYSDRPPPPPDRGADLGCGPGADRALVRLGNLATETLALGDEGPLVGAAQQVLCVAGYPVPPDGRFDLEMEAAILAFQSDHNATAGLNGQLVVSGMLDGQTRRVLEDRARLRLAP